ncbi:MAG TPA: CidA/LrgA family protein [Porticoccaceae bacterium]|nr:CidA/LrgA family protein [Porticoccaceae bacterium]
MGIIYFCRPSRHRAISIITKGLKLIAGLTVLVLFQWLGELVVKWTGVIVPGSLMGMLILLICLAYPSGLAAIVGPVSNRLIQNFSLLFIPACVGVFSLGPAISLQIPQLMVVIALSTLLVIIFMTVLITTIGAAKND